MTAASVARRSRDLARDRLTHPPARLADRVLLDIAVTPTSDEQIRFLGNLQRLLNEGLFVASYKFALLLSLAELSIAKGDDSGSALTVSTDEIAEEFIKYYWRQAVRYTTETDARVLHQNTGKQAAVVNLIQAARERSKGSLAAVMRQTEVHRELRREISKIIRIMPSGSSRRSARIAWTSCMRTPALELLLNSGRGLCTAFASFTR
jgi:hypothetical protein